MMTVINAIPYLQLANDHRREMILVNSQYAQYNYG